MKIIIFESAAEALQLPVNIVLHAMNPIRVRRPRANRDDLCHMIEGLGAIEAAGLVGGQRIGSRRSGRRRSLSCSGRELRGRRGGAGLFRRSISASEQTDREESRGQ